jgi:hypothetical protein
MKKYNSRKNKKSQKRKTMKGGTKGHGSENEEKEEKDEKKVTPTKKREKITTKPREIRHNITPSTPRERKTRPRSVTPNRKRI